MSTPSNPFDGPDDRDQDQDKHSNTGEGHGTQGYPQYPRYEPTSHPEDTGFTSGADYPSYGMGYGQGYGQSYGQGYGSGYGQPPGAQAMEQGSGRIEPLRAISWGFSQAYRNWRVWILGALAMLAVSAVIGVITALSSSSTGTAAGGTFSIFTNILTGLVSAAIAIFILRGVLHQVDDPAMSWGDFIRDVNFWPTLLLQFIIGLLSSLLLALVAGATLVGYADQLADPTAIENATEQEILAAAGAMLGALGLVLLITVLVQPLIVFMPYFLVERRASFGGAISQGFRVGARNYLRLLGIFVIAGILAFFAIVLTFGLAAIFLIGPMYLALGHMYRQAAGGPVPARRGA